MISTKELQKKAKEILESLDGMAVGYGINVLVLALSWLIEYSVKKYEHGECVDDITELLKSLLVCNDGIEYVRKDALVKKACEWLYKRQAVDLEVSDIEKFVRDFKKAMEE